MNISIIFKTTAILLIGLMVSACTSDNEDHGSLILNERGDIELTAQTRAIADELSDFYVNITTDIVSQTNKSGNESDNVVMSPISIAMMLSMIANGCDENSSISIIDYLGVSDLNSLNNLCALLLDKLPESDNSTRLNLANSLWVNKSAERVLTDSYSLNLNQNYNAVIRFEDFNNSSLKKINDWCRSNTNNQITNMFDVLNPDCMAIFLNAMAFNATWVDGIFEAANTKRTAFHGMNHDSEVDMMEASKYLNTKFASDDDLIYFNIPFGNKAFSLSVIFPKDDAALSKKDLVLSKDRYEELIQKSSNRDVKISLPKLSVSFKSTLNDVLQTIARIPSNLNMVGFIPQISGDIMYQHSSTLTIDESGADATAISSGEIINSALIGNLPEGPVSVIVDQPFYFFINEYSTGACILSGRITNL